MSGVGPQPGYGVNPQHGAYYFPNKQGRLFAGVNQAVVATALPAGLTASYTGGLVLWNPVASTVKLAINAVGVAFIAAQANAAVIGIGVGSGVAPTGGTLVPSKPLLVGSTSTAKGLLYSAAAITLPAVPYLAQMLLTVDTGALTVGVNGGLAQINIGSIILLPGSYACFVSSAAGTANSFFGSFLWEETS